jgi:cell division protein FtsQ
MSGEFIYVGRRELNAREIQDDVLLPDIRKGRGKADKWLIRTVVLVAVILLAELVWLFGITPLLPLSEVEITGNTGLDRAALLSRAGINAHSSYFTVNTALAEESLASLYRVESVRVLKKFPGTVRIFIDTKRPTALSLFPVKGRILPVYLDKEGMIIRVGAESHTPASLEAASLPIVSGLRFDRIQEGVKPKIPMRNFFAQLDAINAAAPELLTLISEIKINEKAFNNFDLVLYPVNSAIRFRMDAELSEDALRYMILMIDVFEQAGLDIDEVDLRNGTASYAVKEAYSG